MKNVRPDVLSVKDRGKGRDEMNILFSYEAAEKLDVDWKGIVCSVIEKALSDYGCPYEVQICVTFVSPDEMKDINRETRQIDRPTDVLSFPMIEYIQPGDFSVVEAGDVTDYFDPETGELILGDIVLCTDRILKQAEEYGHSVERELGFLTAHSMLHLFGFDHMEEDERIDMERRQEEILKQLDLTRE